MLEPEQLAELPGHVVAEELETAASGLLGGIHRDIRMSKQLLSLADTAEVERDSDARPDDELASSNPDRLGECLEQPLGHRDSL